MAAAEARPLRVEVVYALPEEQSLVTVELPARATARQAVEASGLLDRYPQIDLARAVLGVFGEVVAADHVLRDGDRVEIYRPLLVDPREARRIRAQWQTGAGRKPGRR